MGKKVKPNSLLDGSNQEVPREQEAFEDKSLVGNGTMTAEAKEKLEKYDALEKSVTALSKEKEILESKVAEYAEKLAELKTAADQIHDLIAENNNLKKQLDDAGAESSSIESLRRENKALRSEVDSYLVKISELTFDNANLTCQLDEVSKQMAAKGTTVNQAKFSPTNNQQAPGSLREPNKDAYNPYKNNGYGSWN